MYSEPRKGIGVNITAFGRKLMLFLAPSRFPAFHLKCPAFFAYFQLEKMRSMRSAQCQVELRRLGNQLPVLGKANSLCKIVCVKKKVTGNKVTTYLIYYFI